MDQKKCCKCGSKNLTNYVCKCGKTVCLRHRYGNSHLSSREDSHECSHDVRTEWNNEIERKNPVIAHPKINKI